MTVASRRDIVICLNGMNDRVHVNTNVLTLYHLVARDNPGAQAAAPNAADGRCLRG